MKAETEALPVGVVQFLKLRELQASLSRAESGARLLARGFRRQLVLPSARRPAQIRMRLESALAAVCAPPRACVAHSSRANELRVAKWAVLRRDYAGCKPPDPRLLGHPRRMLEEMAEQPP